MVPALVSNRLSPATNCAPLAVLIDPAVTPKDLFAETVPIIWVASLLVIAMSALEIVVPPSVIEAALALSLPATLIWPSKVALPVAVTSSVCPVDSVPRASMLRPVSATAPSPTISDAAVDISASLAFAVSFPLLDNVPLTSSALALITNSPAAARVPPIVARPPTATLVSALALIVPCRLASPPLVTWALVPDKIVPLLASVVAAARVAPPRPSNLPALSMLWPVMATRPLV